ncbi:MAG: sodium:solute symporter [Sedimentisphaeraceae bacterium JB056]
MSVLDWSIIAAFLVILTSGALYTRKFNKSVSDFLAANRCAGRYIITVAQGIAGIGAISIIAGFEMFYQAGFSAAWWQLMTLCIVTFVSLSGWVFYRFRQTRALTMAQFIEMRYSRNLRIFTGILAWLSGVINFGIFPSVTARFFIHFCGLPNTLPVYAGLMAMLILIAMFFTLSGGQITVITTDFIQGTFCNIIFVVVIIFLFTKFDWGMIINALQTAPENESMLNPVKTTSTEGFNIWFYLIMAFNMLYGTGIWQGSQGYNACAVNPHEARMGRILSSWRMIATNLFMVIVAVCAFVFFKDPSFAVSNQAALDSINSVDNTVLRDQITTSIAMKYFLPTGLLGCVAAVFLAASISTDTTYLHSWGSILIQDVVMPFRKTHLPHEKHISLLKWSIAAVALFIYIFSLVFRHTEHIYMFFMITGAIFVGGAGAVVIGGLYWKKGTTAGGWAGMITGSTLSVSVILLKQFFKTTEDHNALIQWLISQNGAVLSFYAAVAAIVMYVAVSLLTCKENFNLDQMLHKDLKEETEKLSFIQKIKKKGIMALLGITGEFNLRDKIVYLMIFGWTVLLITIFVVGTIYNLVFDVSEEAWAIFWKYYIAILVILSVITTVWFAVGGFRDLSKMFSMLKTMTRDESDDGQVKH